MRLSRSQKPPLVYKRGTLKAKQQKGKDHNPDSPTATSESFHRTTRLGITHSLPFFLGNVFWILAKILCLYNTMLCGMAEGGQHAVPSSLTWKEKGSQQISGKKIKSPSSHPARDVEKEAA